MSEKNNEVAPKPMAVIVVTDIGSDIDDTLALLALLGARDAVKIVALVTSVNDGEARGAFARGMLRLLGSGDEEIEILPSSDNGTAKCHPQEGFPSPEESNLGELEKTPERILEICRDHMENGVLVLGIAPLNPLAAAISMDTEGILAKSVRGVYLMGNVLVSREENGDEKTEDVNHFAGEDLILHPNLKSYNFETQKDSENAAEVVFEHFQRLVPFKIIGKFAAYDPQIRISKQEFMDWQKTLDESADASAATNVSGKIHPAPNLLELVKKQLEYYDPNTASFKRTYGEIKDKSDNWFDALDSSWKCSLPYDPLLALIMIDDIRRFQKSSFYDGRNLFIESKAKSKTGHMHSIVGNLEGKPVSEDAAFVHQRMSEMISEGLKFHEPEAEEVGTLFVDQEEWNSN